MCFLYAVCSYVSYCDSVLHVLHFHMVKAQFEKHESELKELSNNIEALRRNFSELYELKFVLRHTEDFLIEVA